MVQVIQEQGPESVEQRIGVDATGARFNSIIAVEAVRTVEGAGAPEMNSLVNPGAIATTSMVKGASANKAWDRIIGRDERSDLAGLRVHRDHRHTRHRNLLLVDDASRQRAESLLPLGDGRHRQGERHEQRTHASMHGVPPPQRRGRQGRCGAPVTSASNQLCMERNVPFAAPDRQPRRGMRRAAEGRMRTRTPAHNNS